MKALFFVYTPFQFLVAQLIVKQECLKDSVLIEGYVGNNSHFIDIYKLLRIDSLWGKSYIMPDLPHWDGLVIRNFGDVRKAYSNFKKIKEIAQGNHVDTFFLGENKNQSIRFTAKVFSHLGYKIAFFEEGLAHYINCNQSTEKSLAFKMKVLLRDMFYYLPLYHVRFAEWRYLPGKPLDETFPMDARYSILPVYRGEKEHLVVPSFQFSDSLKYFMSAYMEGNSKQGKRNILLLTQPLHEVYHVEDFDKIYLKVIANALDDASSTVYVKFHPRDTEKRRIQLLDMLSSKLINYVILSEEINLPVEVYLQYMQFDKILFFSTSTYVYNGYLFPKQNFSCLLPELNAVCVKAAGHEFELYKELISFFDMISNLTIK